MPSTEEKKTLIILSPGFPGNESDTTCLPFLQSHVRAMRNNSHSMEIIILAFQYPFFKSTYRWENIEVISFGGRGGAKIQRLLLWTKVWKELKRLRREKNIIGFFSLWCTECSLIGHYFGRFFKIKHYTWICGQDSRKENRYVKLIHPKAEEIIANSDFMKREFCKNHGIDPASVIPHGIDPEQFKDEEVYRDIDILGAGSLIPLKQYDLFINVIHELKASFHGIKTILCGDGPEQARLNSLIESQQLQNQISLYGEVAHPEVIRLMKRAKIFLHTSNFEGLGMVCLEALCAGAHVVSFTKPFDIEIPHWHHVKDKKEMVKKITELMNDKTIKHSPVLPYHISDIVKQIMGLFGS